jgi:hypothetical protein
MCARTIREGLAEQGEVEEKAVEEGEDIRGGGKGSKVGGEEGCRKPGNLVPTQTRVVLV